MLLGLSFGRLALPRGSDPVTSALRRRRGSRAVPRAAVGGSTSLRPSSGSLRARVRLARALARADPRVDGQPERSASAEARRVCVCVCAWRERHGAKGSVCGWTLRAREPVVRVLRMLVGAALSVGTSGTEEQRGEERKSARVCV